MSYIANEFQCSRQNISDILKRAYIRIRHSKYANELIDFLPEYSMRNVYEKYETRVRLQLIRSVPPAPAPYRFYLQGHWQRQFSIPPAW